MSLYPAALKDVLGSQKYSDITVNLFGKHGLCNLHVITNIFFLFLLRHTRREQQVEQNTGGDQGIPNHHECLSGWSPLCGHHSKGSESLRQLVIINWIAPVFIGTEWQEQKRTGNNTPEIFGEEPSVEAGIKGIAFYIKVDILCKDTKWNRGVGGFIFKEGQARSPD